ncbi:unnamed protein product [Rhizophagus irregularis]|nr:unnamed protein product [Rhizophagus irregularis]
MIYLGFFLHCSGSKNNSCVLPVTYVMSRNRWKCNKHLAELSSYHVRQNVNNDSRFFIDQIKRMTKRARKRNNKNNELDPNLLPLSMKELESHNKSKRIHSKRLGVSYTVTVKKYNHSLGSRSRTLRAEMRDDNFSKKKWNPDKPRVWPYFKQYNALRFYVVRSDQQVARWN